ncbi:hypothetical protein LIER_31764 [Lithospermum erythrorhizon]|uniref:Uncharacterized protein n=1 Tax=Lithospermum erythrorhizon TaxID=34254 RepID=A0AAV3RRX7_LITER
MAAEEVLNLLDSYWFEDNILEQKVKFPSTHFVEEETKLSDIASTLEIRSISARCLRYEPGSPFKDYSSPKSVLISSPKLQKIQSGKEISEFSKDEIVKNEQNRHGKRKKRINNNRRRGISRSLSDLEYEEVKGFMDLGFVFSEEDKDSSLASIIPGLQRWCLKKNYQETEKEKEKSIDECHGSVSRPYLSEAWEVLEQRKANRQLSKWKLPTALVDESNIKNHLKAWAQTVASTVR